MVERFPKSGNRFLDKKRDETQGLERFVEPSETKTALATDDDKEALDLDVRRRDLEKRLVEKGVLKDRSTEQTSQAGKTETEKTQLGQAVKLASEFLAAVVVGVMLGLGFDQVTGFAPWGMVVFLFLGFAAGVLNMLRAIGAVEPHQGER